jgi:hypothetical protein
MQMQVTELGFATSTLRITNRSLIIPRREIYSWYSFESLMIRYICRHFGIFQFSPPRVAAMYPETGVMYRVPVSRMNILSNQSLLIYIASEARS